MFYAYIFCKNLKLGFQMTMPSFAFSLREKNSRPVPALLPVSQSSQEDKWSGSHGVALWHPSAKSLHSQIKTYY